MITLFHPKFPNRSLDKKIIDISGWKDPIYIGTACAGEESELQFTVINLEYNTYTYVSEWNVY